MYIFGYGSLINGHSRKLTGQTGAAIPAVANGLLRHWGKVDGRYKIAPLVAVAGEGSCNGVLVKINHDSLIDFDRRERGYRRIELDPATISATGGGLLTDPVWVYVKTDPEPPCEVQPIMQTYVDTVLAGCLSISRQFTETFVETTQGWHYPFENDRHQPKYGNLAGVPDEYLKQIDRLVANVRNSI
ncbi:gamma-glutamylcyclotransferase [Photobacterium sp. SDRW27]|uniref:gamma-glutamylcyclotransferase family protein n=1 Tax=Photobacterium obscurum TaxID=2829490 RepID=UPI002244BFE9|nr:gamma-glutamylcyclotransferase family protein [Photobacterium obscurum]MCW8331215.1 gamma-glutamylcyclotransferase [Photobacterium obscurum]